MSDYEYFTRNLVFTSRPSLKLLTEFILFFLGVTQCCTRRDFLKNVSY